MGELILVVDDNLLNLKLASAVLARSGYRVVDAIDASTMFMQLELELPDLIILDLRMPGIDGFDITRLLKHDPRYLDIPIIAMTASGLRQDEASARLAGCEYYVTKPFVFEHLLATIEEGLRFTRVQNPAALGRG